MTVNGQGLPSLLDLLLENQLAETDSGEKGEADVSISCPVITRSMAKAGGGPLPDLDSGP